MTWALWWAQVRGVVRMEMFKTFFSRRGLWIYALALMPVLIYLGHTLNTMQKRAAYANAPVMPDDKVAQIKDGMTRREVVDLLGMPDFDREFRINKKDAEVMRWDYRGGDRVVVNLREGAVSGRNSRREQCSLTEDQSIFATVFQLFYLRLAVFFGCVGIFVNLFRGEMLEKSLHFYLLAPMRREVLLAGKYLAGLIATAVIFGGSTLLQMVSMVWHWDPVQRSQYLNGGGYADAAAYLGVTLLACLGYGSVFLLTGLLFKNPIIPAALILVWEGANWILPEVLKKVSVIHYLQSLCPLPAGASPDRNPILALLESTAAPTPAPLAIAGLMIVTAAILFVASRQVKKLEINYSAD
jgi:outer membrane protein assembly factor BamE (lipoprotein component of BamABCDE complex)/ABC-type transport system involved in multi-copper enzyme maturation permease subunit